LRSLLQEIKTSISNQGNTDDERTESKNEGFDAVPPKPNPPPAPPQEKHSGKKCRNRLDIARFVVEVLGLIGLVVYAVLTYFMYCETKKAANAAESASKTADMSLKVAERAWLTYKIFPMDIVYRKPLTFTMELFNSGPTPARMPDGKIKAQLVKRGEQIDFTYDQQVQYFRGGMIFPNRGYQIGLMVCKTGPITCEQLVVGDAELTGIKTGDLIIIVNGEVTFRDVFDVKRRMRFCGPASSSGPVNTNSPVPNQALANCMAYNDVDTPTNQEYYEK